MKSAPSATGPSRLQRDRRTPYSDTSSLKVKPAALTPIPIQLVLTAETAVVNNGSVPNAQIVAAMAGWKWVHSFEDGFGTILPSRVRPWKLIQDLMVAAVVNGFVPGPVKPENPESDWACIFADVRIAGREKQANIAERYVAACERGDASFQLKIGKVWTCEDRVNGVCFGGDSEVLMTEGGHQLVRDLAVGDCVMVPGGTAKVAAVWRAHVGRSIPMTGCIDTSCIDGVLLTPDHPVFVDGIWLTAGEVAAPTEVEVDSVYNFALTALCSLFVRGSLHAEGNIECCTLGMPVPGFPEPVWGTEKIFDKMRALRDYPNVATCC